jgi:hypothetical protein
MKKNEINITEVKSACIDTSFGAQNDGYVEITEWANGEGADIFIDRTDTQRLQVTWSELEGIVRIAKKVWDIN